MQDCAVSLFLAAIESNLELSRELATLLFHNSIVLSLVVFSLLFFLEELGHSVAASQQKHCLNCFELLLVCKLVTIKRKMIPSITLSS